MHRNKAWCRAVLISFLLTACSAAAVLFFGLRYAESEPVVFLAAALLTVISAAVTGNLPQTKQEPKGFLALWIFPAVILGGLMILSMMFQYPANSKRETMNTVARQLLNAANDALEDMQKADQPVPDSPYIIGNGDTPEQNSLAERITYYYSDVAKVKSYALVLKQTKDGVRAAEAYCSFDIALTPDTLTETPKEVQLRQLGRMYRQTPLIFCRKAADSVLASED